MTDIEGNLTQAILASLGRVSFNVLINVAKKAKFRSKVLTVRYLGVTFSVYF